MSPRFVVLMVVLAFVGAYFGRWIYLVVMKANQEHDQALEQVRKKFFK